MNSIALVFLQASVSALVTSTVAWAALRLAQRRWPSLAARRAPWLLALLAGVVTFLLVMLPAASRYSVLPVTVPAAVASAPAVGPMQGDVGGGSDDLEDANLLPLFAWLWLACYAAGAGWNVWRWQQAHRAVRNLLQAAERLDAAALSAHAALAGMTALPPVLEVDAPIAPMLTGLRRPALLLPRHLRRFAVEQQQLIVAHELTHLRRSDHLWQHTGALLQTLLWFIPAAHDLRERLQWAQELGCDRAVLADRPASVRRSYAQALLAQLNTQRLAAPLTALQFGTCGRHKTAMADRLHRIRDAVPAAPAPWAGAAAMLLLPALCGASVLLQPRLAWRDDAVVAAAPAGVTAVTPQGHWLAPLAQIRVTSAFSSTNRPSGKPHGGIDLGASRGTVVMAPADGRVVVSTDRYEAGWRYGKVIVIEHGNGLRTLYAHLDTRTVGVGDSVRAGQEIALSGASGKVTGPHLHFEVQRGGAQIDPADMLGSALPRAPVTPN
jgi:murein DD-endopeptidase MepM/ murein hydrolase activator NlpD